MITAKVDNVTRIRTEQLSVTPPCPKSVKIELTSRCNYRCAYCALATRQPGFSHDMDWELFRAITWQMRAAGVEEIGGFYIGESFLAHDLLVKAIRWCKQELKFPYVFLTTNGSLATPTRVREVMEAGLDSLKFSVNASDPKQFEKLMGVKGGMFWTALSNLKEAFKVRALGGYKCGLYASSIKCDGEQPEKMEALLRERVLPFVDEHYWLPLYSMGSLATKREGDLGYTPTAGNRGRLDALRDPLPCWAVFTAGHVTADGMLSACCFDADNRWAMGDLREATFMEAWWSKKFQELRAAHLRKDVKGTPCAACVALA